MEQSPRAPAEAVRTWGRPGIMLPAFLLVALLGGALESFSLSANLLVLGVGGTLTWLGLTGRAGRQQSPTRLPAATAWWLVPVLLFALVELYTFANGSTEDYPTLSLLADPLLDQYVIRTSCYFAWLVAFWGLVRR